jgi:hypothetical protein
MRDRKYVEIDRDNFNDVMKKIGPKIDSNGKSLAFRKYPGLQSDQSAETASRQRAIQETHSTLGHGREARRERQAARKPSRSSQGRHKARSSEGTMTELKGLAPKTETSATETAKPLKPQGRRAKELQRMKEVRANEHTCPQTELQQNLDLFHTSIGGTKLVRDPSQTEPIADAVSAFIEAYEKGEIKLPDDVDMVGAINKRIAALDRGSKPGTQQRHARSELLQTRTLVARTSLSRPTCGNRDTC